MRTNKIVMLGICAAAVLTGCAKMQEVSRANPAPLSPFIKPYEAKLVRQKATFPFHYFYLKKDAGNYENVYVSPVNIRYLKENKNWALLDQKVAEQVGSDINKVAQFMQKTYKEEFRKVKGERTLKVVESLKDTKKKTLIVDTAIVSIVPTKAELVLLGTAGNLLLPGIGILAGQAARGSITIECIIRDAQTKEIIAMYANTENDQRAVLNFAGMTWYTSAEKNIRKQAESTAKVFSGTDYSYIYRRLIKIIEF